MQLITIIGIVIVVSAIIIVRRDYIELRRLQQYNKEIAEQIKMLDDFINENQKDVK